MSTESPEIRDERLDHLAEAIGGARRVLIIPHDYPDPDALASAAALHVLLKQRFNVLGQIAITGEVSRAENKELLRQLRVSWHLMSNLRRVPNRRKMPCILVDTAPWSRNVTVPSFARPVAVLDHHQHPNWHGWKHRSIHADIRAGAGATTTIAYEYLKRAGIEPPRWLAAIMAYAIVTETLDLSRDGDKADTDAYIELAARADHRIIGRIRHASLPREYFGHLQEAIENARRIGTLAFSHLENVEQPEIVAEIADLLLRMEGIKWSFCTANFDGGAYVSVRSRQSGAHCSRILRSVVGSNGSAGGHHSMAAGFLKLYEGTWAEREGRRQIFVRSLVRRIVRSAPDDPDAFAAAVHSILESPATAAANQPRQLKLELHGSG